MMEVTRVSRLAYAYLCAKDFVFLQGFGNEVEWQRSRRIENASETDFLRESAWVVMAGGMRESVVRRCFTGVTEAFRGWVNAKIINSNRTACIRMALSYFNHAKKIEAIADIALHVDRTGFEQVKHDLQKAGVPYLQEFPFIGPVTSYHLAKNLGLDVVKPDRHLVRIADALGYSSPTTMCVELAAITGERLSVIDIIMWRYATLVPDYLTLFVNMTPP